MRVAFVTVGDTSRRTGGYLYNARVSNGLRASGMEVEEIVAGGASAGEQRLAARIDPLPDPALFDVIVVDALARVAVAPHVDRWRSVRPVVAMVHELPSVAGVEENAYAVAREREFEEPLLRADRLIAVSEHGRGILKGRGVPAGRISVVRPGSDRLVRSSKARKPPDAPVRALCVAQWIPRKGIHTLVDAWTRLGDRGAVLELVGETDADAGYAGMVRSAIAAAPEGSVVVRGTIDDAALAEAYEGADLFVLPSRYEGYGVVYAEALSYGLPVIACDAGPVPEVVGREAARLVPPDDPEALREALEALVRDTGLRDRMARAARRRAGRLPRWEDTERGFREALRAAVRSRTGVG